MATNERHLELLLGRNVYDTADQCIGRIEEVRAEKVGDEWVIQEYLLGTTALLERLSAWSLGVSILRLFGAHKLQLGYRVPWDKLDLSDVDHLRLSCTIDALQPLDKQTERSALVDKQPASQNPDH